MPLQSLPLRPYQNRPPTSPGLPVLRRTPLGSATHTALRVTIASLLIARASALTIIPVWDSSITNDPNAAQVESVINSVINTYETAFSGTNITLKVNVLESSTIGGANNSPNTFSTTYTAYRAALQSHATTLDDVAVVAGLTPTSPLNSSTNVTLSRANAAALGFSVPTNADGSVTTGTVRLGITSGAPVDANYITQLFGHEFDEEMGTISGVPGSTPWSIDFTRYSAAGQRSFNGDTSTHAYFSIDGVNMLAQYNQFNRSSGDWGDLAGGGHVQDYYVSGTTVLAVELRMLDSVGYGYTGRSVSNAFVKNTLNTVPLSTVTTASGVIPNAPSNDVQITEGGGSGVVTLASASTVVNSLLNTATTTAVTVNLAGQQLVAGSGSVDAGVGLIEVGSGAAAMTVGASPNDGTVTAGTSGAYTLGLISANPASTLDIKSSIVNNAGGGPVSVIVLNTGTVILEGTNTYSGTTTIGTGATLQVGNAGSTGSLGTGGVEVDGTLIFNRSGTTTVSGALTGGGPTTQAGTGTVIFSGNNGAYTGAFTINAGATLQFGNGGTTGDAGAGTVANNGTLIFNRSDNITLSSAISGTGTLIQAGTGVLTATNISSANVAVQAGTLQFGGNLNFTGGVTVSGGTFQLSGAATLAGGNYSSAITNNGLFQDSSTANLTITGVISGSGDLTKDTSTSTLTLTRQNTYTGATTVNAGTLALNFSATGAPAANILAPSSTLILGNGAITFTGASGASNTQTFAGTTITGTVGSLALVPNGAAGLDVNLGVITFNPASAISFNGATGTAAGARFLTSTGSANAMLGSGAMYNGTDWAAKDASNTYIVAYTGYTDIYTGTTGSKPIAIPNTAFADIRIQENGSAGAPNTLVNSTTTINSLLMNAGTTSATIAMGGGTLILNGGAGVTGAVAVASGAKGLTIGSPANDGTITAGASGTSTLALINNSSSALTVNSIVANNAGSGAVSLSVSGSGSTVLTGTNSYTGNTSIANGTTLQIAGTGSLGSGASYGGAITDNGTLRWSSSTNQTFSGIIDGAGGITKDTTSSTVTLTGTNTYIGATTVSAGTLQIGGAGSLGGGSYAGAISVASGATLNDASSIAQTFSGAISGAGSIANSGSSTLRISGTSNTFTGTYAVNSGTLVFASAGAVGASGAKVTVASGGTLDLNGLNIGTAYSATVAGSGTSGAGAIVNSGSTKADIAKLTLSGNTTLAPGSQPILIGSTTSTLGSLNLAGFTLTMNGTGTLIFNGLNLTGSGNIVVNSGTLQLMDDYGANQQTTNISGTGTITVNSGASLITPRWSPSLTLSMPINLNGGTLGSDWPGPNGATIASPITISASSSLNFGGGYGNVTLSGVISGGASSVLTVAGDSGTRTFTGVNTYAGNTTVTAGTLTIGGSGSLGAGTYAGAISLASGTTFNYASTAAQTLSGVISGAGALTKAGSSTLTLAATNTYTGATTVNSGTLVVSGSISASATDVKSTAELAGTGVLGAVTIESGGILQPGALAAPGLLSSGNFSLLSGGHLTLEIGGVTGTGTSSTLYSELAVSGTVSLSGDAQISLFNGYTPTVGDTFYIILNDSTDAISGTFSNAPGGIITSGAVTYQVNYQANGDGGANDVSLTVMAVPEPSAAISLIGGLGLLCVFRRRKQRSH